MSELINLGRVTSVFGIQGWVNVFSYTDPITNILNYSPWYLHNDLQSLGNKPSGKGKASEGITVAQCTKVIVADGKKHGKRLIAQIEGCDSRDKAGQYIQHDILIPKEALPDLEEEGSFYWSDLEGLQVIDQDGKVLGPVDHLMETGANDVLVILVSGEGSKLKEPILIPYVRESYIADVNLNEGWIKVYWEQD